jgi:hypothetical protein
MPEWWGCKKREFSCNPPRGAPGIYPLSRAMGQQQRYPVNSESHDARIIIVLRFDRKLARPVRLGSAFARKIIDEFWVIDSDKARDSFRTGKQLSPLDNQNLSIPGKVLKILFLRFNQNFQDPLQVGL